MTTDELIEVGHQINRLVVEYHEAIRRANDAMELGEGPSVIACLDDARRAVGAIGPLSEQLAQAYTEQERTLKGENE